MNIYTLIKINSLNSIHKTNMEMIIEFSLLGITLNCRKLSFLVITTPWAMEVEERLAHDKRL
jgi:hypothetical protein